MFNHSYTDFILKSRGIRGVQVERGRLTSVQFHLKQREDECGFHRMRKSSPYYNSSRDVGSSQTRLRVI